MTNLTRVNNVSVLKHPADWKFLHNNKYYIQPAAGQIENTERKYEVIYLGGLTQFGKEEIKTMV